MQSRQKWVSSVIVVTIATLFVSACAHTTLTAVWKDDAYTGGPLKKILVMAALKNPANRRIVESALVNELKQNGVEGIASYSSMESKELSPENVMAAAKENQANGLMAVRLVGVDEQTVYHVPAYSVPYPYYYSWGTYYPHMHEYTGMPGYTATYKYYNVETNIYATDTEKLVWSAASQTVDPQNINKEANIFARKIVKSLGSSGLL